MDKVLFKNVKVIDTQSRFNGKRVDVLVEEGKIKAIESSGTIKTEKGTIVCENGNISPGWLDMRVYNTDPGMEWKEDLNSLSNAAIKGGFAEILCMPGTHPPIDGREPVVALLKRAAEYPVQVLVCGALTQGLKGKDLAEVYDMKLGGAVAFSDGLHPVSEAGVLMRGLQYLSAFKGVMISFPFDSSVDNGAAVGESVTAAKLGMKGVPDLAESLMISRDVSVMNYTEQPLHIGPVTTSAGIQQVKSGKRRSENFTAETSALYLALDDRKLESFDTRFKVFPPLRGSSDVKALRKAVLDGTIDVISSSHHPQSNEEKNTEFPTADYGASGLETCFSAAWTAMNAEEMKLDEFIEKFTVNPRRILHLNEVKIEEGGGASLTWFDEKESWTVSESDIRSKSKYNPFIGETLQGKPKGVFTKGKFYFA